MIWLRRTFFTCMYLLVVYLLLNFTDISPLVLLLFSIIFSGYISRNGLLAGLERLFNEQ